MAHPVVEIHEELTRLWGSPSKPCFTRLSRSVSLVAGLAHGLVGLGAAVASQQPLIEDAIAHGSFRVPQRNCVFPILGNETGEHMQGSPNAHHVRSVPDPAASISWQHGSSASPLGMCFEEATLSPSFWKMGRAHFSMFAASPGKTSWISGDIANPGFLDDMVVAEDGVLACSVFNSAAYRNYTYANAVAHVTFGMNATLPRKDVVARNSEPRRMATSVRFELEGSQRGSDSILSKLSSSSCFLVHASASLHQQARKCTVVFQPPWLLCPGDVAVGAFFALLLLLNRPEGAEPIFVCVRGLGITAKQPLIPLDIWPWLASISDPS
eukprot:1141504-Pelagomonas_calceolata.AAC.2